MTSQDTGAPNATSNSQSRIMQTAAAENRLEVTAYAKVDASCAWPEGRAGLPVLVRVVAPQETVDRVPVDVVAVLDIGCCHGALGPANRMSLVNRAMDFVIKKLGSQDRLAIIATPKIGEEDSLLAMTSDGQKRAMSRVQALAASGDNKLMLKALKKAAAVLDGRTDEEKEKKDGCIILISDGEDSSICLERLNNMYPVHAFGFRDTHNAMQMHYVAKSSCGTYCVLNDENDQITEAFTASIVGIASVVAVHTKINIEYTRHEAAGRITFSAVEHGKYKTATSPKGASINVGALQAGAARSFIVYIHNVQENERDELPKLLSVQVESSFAGGTRAEKVVGEVVVARKGADGSRKVAAEIVRVVAVDIVGGILESWKGLAGAAADELREKWINLKSTEYGREAGEAGLTAGLDAEMEEMEASMRQGLGLSSYMASWHTRQTLQQHLLPTPPPAAAAATGVVTANVAAYGGWGRGKRKREHYTEMEMIERRMAYWSTVLCGLPPMHSGDCAGHAAMLSQEVSRKSILQAMYQDVFLAVALNTTDRRGSKSSVECPCCLGAANRRHLG